MIMDRAPEAFSEAGKKEISKTHTPESGGKAPLSGTNSKPKTGRSRSKQDPIKSFVYALIRLAAVTGGIALLCIYVICPYAVHGNKMFPKLRDGDCAVVLKVGEFRKGDVVTYVKDGNRYFSRIVGTADDEISIDQEGFRINDMIQMEEIFYETTSEKTVDLRVNDGEVFFLNDYRSDQTDSRDFGCVNSEEIDGKVVFLFRWRGI